MDEGIRERGGALTVLRQRMADGLAMAGLTVPDVVRKTELSSTTIRGALREGDPPPSRATVAAFAKALGVPAQEWLDLLRAATGAGSGPEPVAEAAPGRPIAAWDAYDLEVHPAGASTAGAAGSARGLPEYVERAHDRALAEAVRQADDGSSAMVVLVGSSSTGKTRACWEAVQPLAGAGKGWRLWHPYDPTRADAALADLGRVRPNTVVWLNEAQHYLGDPRHGELIAAALHRLLTDPGCGPVLVLGTLWNNYATEYTELPTPGTPDAHSRVRELLAGRTLTVPDTFDAAALSIAEDKAAAGDRLLAQALQRARAHGRVTQDLAGAPELMRRYEQGTPAVRALLEAAMDARRLGVGPYLPQPFLTDAAADYLTDHDFAQLTDDWAEIAYADLARPVHGKQAPLTRVNPRPARRPPGPPPAPREAPGPGPAVLQLGDFLEQHGRTHRRRLCPPASFWHAADAGDTTALNRLAAMREEAGDRQGAADLLQRAADAGDTTALNRLVEMREEAGDRQGAADLAQRAADAGNTTALYRLAMMREEAGDRQGAADLLQRAADAGDTTALYRLVEMREEAGDRQGAADLAQRAADAGNTTALYRLAMMREEAGDRQGAADLLQRAADAGNTFALYRLAVMREEAGDRQGAADLAQRAADAGNTTALYRLAMMREEAGDRQGAADLLQRAADAGNTTALHRLAMMREEEGDRNGMEVILQQLADRGGQMNHDYRPFVRRLKRMWPYGLDPDGSPSVPW
ncbi:tetratricopeptide repeat protein [Streptacidiphilus sp. PAMC 29251]